MKFVLLLFTGTGCFFWFESKSQTYTYIPFPDSNMVWRLHAVCVSAPGNSNDYYREFSMRGDTAISGNTYTCINTPLSVDYYIREDSARRIYFIKSNGSDTEKLIIDFSLQAGDTIFSGNDMIVVLSVDTPTYLGIHRRSLHVKYFRSGYPFDDVWVEGLGSLTSPISFYGSDEYHLCSGPDPLLCAITVDGVYEYGGCGLSALQELDSRNIFIYPNPAVNIITIESDRLQELKEARLYNSVGFLMATIIGNASDAKLTVPIDSWPAGLYILNLGFMDSSEKTMRFIKSN